MEYEPHIKSFGGFIQKFQDKQPGVKITLQGQPPGEHTTKYQQAFASKTEPDILAIHEGISALFVQSGVLMALNDTVFSNQNIQDRFFKDMIEPYSSKGKMYGLPLANNTPGIGMILNLDAFDEAKIEPPMKFDSWEEVWQTAEKLTKRDGSGKITRAGLNVREGHQMMYLCGFILEQGGKYFDEAKGKFSFNTPEGQAGLKLLSDAIHEYKVDSPDIPNAHDSLANGQSAMGLIWIDYIPYAKSQFPNGHFGFAVRPPIKGNKLIVAGEGGWGVNISARTKNKDQSVAFLSFLNQDDNMLQWLKEQNALPSVKNMIDDPYFKTADAKWIQAAMQTMDGWVSEGPFPVWTVNGKGWEVMESVLTGKKQLNDGLDEITQAADKVYKEFQDQVSSLQQ